MRMIGLSLALLASTNVHVAAPAPAPAIIPDTLAPRGKLPDTVRPLAYRIDLTILPEAARFSGHDEIDVRLSRPARSIYMHGRDLIVTRAMIMIGGRSVPAKWTVVDKTGTVRLDFRTMLPAGKATLSFDYSAPFSDTASGMFHVKVDNRWYSWTQFESIDARAAYPSFDEPGFKTPFTVSVTTHPGLVVAGNAPEISITRVEAGLEKHQLATTKPLPTYLVAVDTGPFVHRTGRIAPDAERSTPLPYGAVATAAEKDQMDYVMAETPRIVSLLEQYFGQPFPFEKLDQIGTPIMPGAMENAGADTYGDQIIFLPPGAPTGDKQSFGMIVAHELSHQWFGDLVTPAWWDDIWLNESFANWMGYRIGNEWRPELKIGVGALDEGFGAMNTDALSVGRPIHQSISDNSQIDSAFDSITYGKGGQVVAMIAAYLGDEKFKQGVRLHVRRHAYGNATSEQFFQSIADAAQDPKVLAAFKSFVDQQGVPLVDVRRDGAKLVVTQSRYAFLGTNPSPLAWTIPFCVRSGAVKQCTLLDQKVTTLNAPGDGPIMPNVGGTGYYRFELAPDGWRALIAGAAELPPGEAIATTDSLWASFRAGRAPAQWLIEEARTMAGNPSAAASTDPGERLAALHIVGLIGQSSLPAFQALSQSIYGPRLQPLGFDPRFGAHAKDAPDQQKLRQQIVARLAEDARDPAVRTRLRGAAEAYLAGDRPALDPGFLGTALTVVAEDGGLPVAKSLIEKGLSTEDPDVRQAELGAAAASGHQEVAAYLLALDDPRIRPFDRLLLIGQLAVTAETRDSTAQWIFANYDRIASGNGIFITSRLPQMLGSQCGVAEADHIEQILGPKVMKVNAGVLEFRRMIERVHNCGLLKQAKSAEIEAAIAAAAH